MLYRTNSEHPDFRKLIILLDEYLAEKDGEEKEFYKQYNTLSNINNVVLFFEDEKCLGCGAFKEYETGVAEIKRMYVLPEARGKGVAGAVLSELESWAKQSGYKRLILEAGIRQTEALQFYKKCGYTVIPNYGQYTGITSCLCFEKSIQ